jgi:soluble lytic murein transglycosylase
MLATAQHDQGRLTAAEETLRTLVAEYPRHQLAPQAALTLARWRWNRDDDAAALERFRAFMRRYPRHPKAADALYATGRIQQERRQFGAASKAYGELVARFPRDPLAAEARWRHGWLDYIQGRYAPAAEYFEGLAKAARRRDVEEGASYWRARATERALGPAAARPLYAALIAEFPQGYYAMWAEGWLAGQAAVTGAADAPAGTRANGVAGTDGAPDGANEEKGGGWSGEGRGITGSAGDSPASPRPLALLTTDPATSALDSARFERAVELDTLGLERHAARELDAIKFPPASQIGGRLVLLEALARVGSYHQALRLAVRGNRRRMGTAGHVMDRFLYPRAYWAVVQKHAAATGVDPYLILALMRQESLCDPAAVSPKGARGLMQLMPPTAARVATALRRPVPAGRDLERPEVNIELGTAYLGELLAAYRGAIHKALAAYNAGEGAVAKWERRYPDAAPDEFVEQISYSETRGYVKAVMRNYRVYRSLYGESAPAPGLTSGGAVWQAQGYMR